MVVYIIGSLSLGLNYGCNIGKLETHSFIQYCSLILCRRKKKHNVHCYFKVSLEAYCLQQHIVTEALLVEMETVGYQMKYCQIS